VAKPAASPVPSPSPSPVAGRIPVADPAVHVFLWGNPGSTQRDLTLAKDAGFHWVKQRFEWRNIEGRNKGNFEWNEPASPTASSTPLGNPASRSLLG
jgi:hypothetical protein